jgi:hypothetical protein
MPTFNDDLRKRTADDTQRFQRHLWPNIDPDGSHVKFTQKGRLAARLIAQNKSL